MSEARRSDQSSPRLVRLLDAGGRLHAGTLKIATTGVVAGWRVLSGPGADFSVSHPGSPDEQVMTREALIELLRAHWAPRARVLLAQDKRETVAAARCICIPSPSTTYPRRLAIHLRRSSVSTAATSLSS